MSTSKTAKRKVLNLSTVRNLFLTQMEIEGKSPYTTTWYGHRVNLTGNLAVGYDIGFATYATNGERPVLITLGPGLGESLQTNPDMLEDMITMLTDIVRSVQF